jgi:hypothetical protein
MLDRMLTAVRIAPATHLPQLSLTRFSEPGVVGGGNSGGHPQVWPPVAPLEWCIVTNPHKRYCIGVGGNVRKQISRRAAGVAAILIIGAVLLPVVLNIVRSSGSIGFVAVVVGVAVYVLIITSFVGFFAWLVLLAITAVTAAYDIGRNPRGVYLRVCPDDDLAWRLCRVTEGVSRTGAWRDGTVDPSRQVAVISWSAIGRSLTAARQLADAKRATTHPSLASAAGEAITKLEQEIDALEHIYLNLGRVLLAAKSVDEQREAAERRRKDQIARSREEAELRQKFSGVAPALDLHDSLTQADRSAGSAAEADAIAQLLADSDGLLRDGE